VERRPRDDDLVGLERDPAGRQVAGRDQLLDVAPRQPSDVGDEAVDALGGGAVGDAQVAAAAREQCCRVRHRARSSARPIATSAAFFVSGPGSGGVVPASEGLIASSTSMTSERLIAASATLNVYQRNVPAPRSTKSTT
jgi:hypothetical protein